MKKTLSGILWLTALGLVTSQAGLVQGCAPKTSKLVIKELTVDPRDAALPAGLPEAGPAEEFQPSLLSTAYRPVQVQFTLSNNPTHFDNPDRNVKSRLLYNMPGFTPRLTLGEYRKHLNKYGSRIDWPHHEATGRFYTKKIDGRCWIIDPEGCMHYRRAFASFRQERTERSQAAFPGVYGTTENWVDRSVDEFAEMGFHGTGAFSHPYSRIQDHNKLHPDRPMIYAPSLNFLRGAREIGGYGYPGDDEKEQKINAVGIVFYDGFADHIMEYARREIPQFAGDPFVLGIFSDNELDFSSKRIHILGNILKVGDDKNPAKRAAMDYMRARGLEPTAAAFEALPSKAEKDAVNAGFAGQIAERYYKACRDAIKAADPDVIYLGSRLHGTPKYIKDVMEAAGRHCDIISINYYSRWDVELETAVKDWFEWADKPFMVTEFYAMAEDSGAANDSGAGFVVRTQTDRGCFYHHFCLGLLEAKNCVGWDWFRYQDDDISNTNKGLYSPDYVQWPELKLFMRHLNYNAYELTEYFDSAPAKTAQQQ